MNAPSPAEIDEQEFQAPFSAPPILGVLTTRAPPGLRGLFRSGMQQWWETPPDTLGPDRTEIMSPAFVALVEEILGEEPDRGE
jgi:hypothetical protein